MKEQQQSSGVFGRLWDNNRTAMILDFIIENRQDSYTVPEISKLTGISNKTVYHVLKKFQKLGLVKIDRLVGIAYLYQYNKDSKISKLLQEVSLEIADVEVKQILL